MWAKILDGGNAPLKASIENDFLTAYFPPQGLGSDLVGGAGDIPGVSRIHEDLQRRLVFMDPLNMTILDIVKHFAFIQRLMDPLRLEKDLE